MGFLASKYDSAYELLKQGTDPGFWDEHIKWESKRGSDDVGLLVSGSIQAIGGTGRPDSLAILNQLKEGNLTNWIDPSPLGRTFYGALVDAYFFYDLVAEHGIESYKLNILTENRNRLQQEWKNTDNGRQWRAWYEAKRQAHYLANQAAYQKVHDDAVERYAKEKK